MPRSPLPSPSFGWPQRAARAGFWLALLALGGWILRGFLPALAWAVILAMACWPLHRRACRAWPGGARLVLPALATLLLALLFLLPLALAAWQVGMEARSVLAWPHATRDGAPPEWLAGLPFLGPQAAGWWREAMAEPGAWAGWLHRLEGAGLLGWGRELGGAVLHRAVLFGFTLLTLFFLFRDGEAVAEGALRAGERLFGPETRRVAAQALASVRGTVSGLVLVGLGEGLLLGIAYAVAGVPHPALLGAMTALAAMVPFAAPLVFGAVALLLLAAGRLLAAGLILGFGMALLFVADHAVRPALIGGATRLPFLWVLLGILGGVESLGLIGLFIGPAVMAVLILLWRDAARPEGVEEGFGAGTAGRGAAPPGG
jgi:predicted PurR-regulated permease PerM